MKTKTWKRIISLLMCYALLMSSPINAIALTTDWEISAPELEDKASEIKLDAEVKAVIEKIDAIGTVTYDDASLQKIIQAETAYNALSAEQKEQVSNYATLLAARNAYDVLQASNEDTTALTLTDSGTVNSTVKWYVYSNGLLEITGEGSIPTYTKYDTAPWYSYAGSITKILVRKTITGIGAYAFYGCDNVTEMILPFVGAERTASGYSGHLGYIFGYTSSSGTVTVAGKSGSYYLSYHYAYYNNSSYETTKNITYYSYNIPASLKKVTITDATSIPDCAFKQCTRITEINLNNGIESVGNYAFCYDTALTNIVLPQSVTTIGSYSFYNTGLSEVFIPNSIDTIPKYAFYNQNGDGISKLSMGANITSIGDYAFYGNSLLQEIVIPQKVAAIGNYTFASCSGITEINIPDSVTTLGGYAFADDGAATKINIGSGLKVIPSYAFQNCSGLTSVVVPDTVTEIQKSAFEGCKSIAEISLPFVGAGRSASGYNGHLGYIFGYTSGSSTAMSYGKSGSYYLSYHYAYYNNSSSETTRNFTYYSYNIPASLKKVTITDATSIPDCAFKQCSNLTEVNLNDGITSIGNYAFCSATALVNFTIPQTVLELGEYSFYNTALQEIYIPNSVINIRNYAFYGCEDVVKLIIGKNVISIGDYAFYNNSALTHLVIPEKVTNIGNYAFASCSGITEINIPDSVTTLGDYAFADDGTATKINIGSGLKVIPSYAFQNCSGLTSVVVPDTVTEIQKSAFEGCKSIAEISLPFVGAGRSASGYNGHLGYIFGYTSGSSTAMSYGKSGSYYLSYHYAYYNNSSSETTRNFTYYSYNIPASLKKVTITDATSIPDCAFNQCTNINEIILNNELQSVGAYTFNNVPWFSTLTDEFVVVGDGVLIKYNGSVSGITIPEDVKYIGGSVFYNNDTISEVNIHNKVVGIGREAFSGCDNLSSLTIPKTVTTIGLHAIPTTCVIYVYRPSAGYNYRSSDRVVLNSTYVTGNDTFYYIVNDDNCIEIIGCTTTSSELTVPTEIEGLVVNKIGDYGFSKCTTIKSITIPSNIISIGKYAFNGCTGLVNATIPTTVKSVGDYAFNNCTGLENVTISEGVMSIGEGAFYNCTSLVEAVVPDTATTVGSHAFYNCTAMTTATIGISAEAINDYTFYNCEKLNTVVIGISVKSIGDYAFYNCNLERVSVPQTVTSIGDYAFASNDAMTRATLRKNLLTIGEGAFQDCSTMATVSIPSSVTDIGKAAFENCASITTITVPVGVTVINDLVFSGCEKLATVKINGEVTSIGISAFYNCAFENITLPETVATLKASAFRKCTKLTEITIPDATKTIGDSAFLDCSALATVSIPDDVTSVGNGVFFYNNDLTVNIRYLTGTVAAGILEKQGVCHVVLDENITTIGDRVFALCYSLKDITYGDEEAENGSYKFSKNITAIGKEAFVDDVLLKNLVVPDSLQTMGADTIYNPIVTEYNCKDVTATFYYVNGSIAESILSSQDYSHIVVEDNIHTIGSSAFRYGDQLVTISLPDTISTIGSNVFAESSGNLTATIRGVDGTVDSSAYDGKTSGIQYLVIDENVNTIGANAFANSSTIKGVVINNTATIDDYAFYKGAALDYVEIGATDTIDAYAFAENLVLKRVEIDKVKAINDYAFFNCIAMNDIYVDSESGLEHIGEHTFEECKLMPELILPETVRNIGAYAFYNCNSMAYINIPAGVPAINDYTFFGCASLKEMLLPNSVITVGDYAFYGCVVVKNMTLGNQTTSIGEYAFYNCNKISSLEIPGTVTEIGDYAFRSCSSITDLHIPDSVVSLGDCVFYSCTGLEQVEFGTGITTIGDRVFYACVALDKVMFNAPIEEIHDLAFYGAEDATLYAFEDEYVETYCNDFGLMYYNLGGDFTMTITAPSKTSYSEYEELDLTGLELHLSYTNGSERTIRTGYTISGYDPAVIGSQTVTVTYNGVDATFDVTVTAKTVSFITISAGAPVDTIVGEDLDFSAMVVTVTFTDGTNANITEGYTVTGYDKEVVGEQAVTISYREGSQELTVTVKDYVRGDTNGDGIVSMKDVTRLVNYLNDNTIAVIDKSLDINGDGIVSIKDVTRLTEYLEDNTVEIH